MAFIKNPLARANAAYGIPPDMLEAISALTTALDARVRVDAAIAQNAASRQSASESRAAAEAEVGRLELELALEIDGAKITALERAVDEAHRTAQEAVTAFDRADRLQCALYARAPEADAQIAAGRQAFQTALGAYGRTANEALAVEARDAAQRLVGVLKRGHAMAFAVGNLSRSGGFLGDVLIPSPAPSQPPIIAAAHADAPDGSRADLAADWRTDRDAAALAEIMRPLTDLIRRLAVHVAFAPPPAPAKPYEAQNRRTAEEAAAERSASEAVKPPASTWAGQAWAMEYGAKSPMPQIRRSGQ